MTLYQFFTRLRLADKNSCTHGTESGRPSMVGYNNTYDSLFRHEISVPVVYYVLIILLTSNDSCNGPEE